MKKLNVDEFFIDFDLALDFEAAYYNKKTGEIEMFMEEDVGLIDYNDEEIENLDDERKEIYKKLEKIHYENDDKNYVSLPTQHDVHEWSIMKDYCSTVQAPELQRKLLDAIHGTGAFRMFKNITYHNNMQDEWDKFRDNAIKEIIRDWCDDNKIEYE